MQQYLLAAQVHELAAGGGRASKTSTSNRNALQTGPAPTATDVVELSETSATAAHSQADLPLGSIVVGVDGSPAADAAAQWAAREAVRRSAALCVVHAYRLPNVAGDPGYTLNPDDLLEQLRSGGDDLLQRTTAQVAAVHPSLAVATVLRRGRAESVLAEASAHARLTVVGNATSSRVALLGSVALAVTSTNRGPVAVIHLGHTDSAGPIVVGVDGSTLSDAAVEFAFDEAAVRGAELVAVHAWNDVYADAVGFEPLLIDPPGLEQQERALLSERIAGWADKYPDVVVRQVLAHQRPTTALLEQSRHAQMVVVGSHGRGGFTGMLLGSTSHALATHARCPIVVVRRLAG
jgi:nucleotide-binding universal stress UspA family protein